jgi:5-methylcytosine-specific restriction endonuclease McrA
VEFISRKEAQKAGSKFYFTGRPCVNGHLSPRYTPSMNCVKCKQEAESSPQRIAYKLATQDHRTAYHAVRNRKDRKKRAAYMKTAKGKAAAAKARKRYEATPRAKALHCLRESNRRALKRGVEIRDLTPQQWEYIKTASGHRCAYCKRKSKSLEQDHITPISQGGNHSFSNIVPACKSCNSKKCAGSPLAPVQPMLLAE